MRHIVVPRPVPTEETHRATTIEIFFDLVFAFALTRVTAFMGHPPTLPTLAQGLIILLLLWTSWTTYTWLSDQARADVGLIGGGILVAMAALFVAALVIPDAWRHGGGVLAAPLMLALTYVVIRGTDVGLYYYAAVGNPRLRTTLRIFAITTTTTWVPLILGAVLGGTAQTLLWAAAFLIDFSGGFIASRVSGWDLPSPSHFTERHGLVLIIALGESLISIGVGAGTAVIRGQVLVAALLGFSITVCLWWFYFKNTAAAGGMALGMVPIERRGMVGSNAYSLAHFPLIAGVIYIALGIEQVIARLAGNQPQPPAGAQLGWTSTAALYGGAALYLTGRIMFLRLSVRSAPPSQYVAAGTALVLLPIARFLPALAALGLFTAFLIALHLYERLNRRPVAVEVTDT
jgi:low temperature requirement protein LtrA